MGEIQQIVQEKIDGFIRGFAWLLPNLGIAAAVIIMFVLISYGVRRGVENLWQRRGRGDLALLLGQFARWFVLFIGFLVVATIIFPSVKPADVLSALGVGSVAIGFAFKDILQNWLAGLLILYRRPFRQGDQIAAGAFEGTVEHVEARATLIRTYDGQRVVIPNAEIYTQAVVVRTAFERRRSEYDVGIGYGDDVSKACEVMQTAVCAADGVASDPVPEALAWALDSSSVKIKLRWWTEPRMAELVHTRAAVIAGVKRALQEAGIDMPFSTHVVLFHDQTEDSDGDRYRQREGWPPGEKPPQPRHLNNIALAERKGRTG